MYIYIYIHKGKYIYIYIHHEIDKINYSFYGFAFDSSLLGKFKRDSQLFASLEVCIWIARATIVVNLIQKHWMSGDATKFYHIQYQLFSLRLFLYLYRQNRS